MEKELITQRIERNQLEDGDHIYVWRAAFSFSHHGIYIGEGKVVHFTNQGTEPPPIKSWSDFCSLLKSSSGFSSLLVSSQNGTRTSCQGVPNCGIPKKPESGVMLSCLDCFLKGATLNRFKYGVSQLFLVAKLRGGTCTMASEDPPEVVIHRAMHLLENGFGKYHLMDNNCEDFALYCKSGLLSTGRKAKGLSSQAHVLRADQNQTDPNSAEEGFFHKYHKKRLYFDLGNRQDVVRVPVEEIASFMLSRGFDSPNCNIM